MIRTTRRPKLIDAELKALAAGILGLLREVVE